MKKTLLVLVSLITCSLSVSAATSITSSASLQATQINQSAQVSVSAKKGVYVPAIVTDCIWDEGNQRYICTDPNPKKPKRP